MQLQLQYNAPTKPMFPEFVFGGVDFTYGGVLGDQHDEFAPPETPSLATEASFPSCDDGMPALSSQDASRETTSFPN